MQATRLINLIAPYNMGRFEIVLSARRGWGIVLLMESHRVCDSRHQSMCALCGRGGDSCRRILRCLPCKQDAGSDLGIVGLRFIFSFSRLDSSSSRVMK